MISTFKFLVFVLILDETFLSFSDNLFVGIVFLVLEIKCWDIIVPFVNKYHFGLLPWFVLTKILRDCLIEFDKFNRLRV